EDSVDGLFVVGVREEDLRTLAAELERYGDDAVGRETEDRLSRIGRTGERDLRNERVDRKWRPDLVAGPGDDVQYASGQVLRADARERERGERRVRRRLEHDGVPGDERRRDLPRGDEDRHVPRHDRGDDAERLAPRIREHRLAERDSLALQLAAKAPEVAEHVGHRLRLSACLGQDGIARLPPDPSRDALDSSLDVT